MFKIFCPVLDFQSLEIFYVFPVFPAFLGKKKENLGETLFIKNGPMNILHNIFFTGRHVFKCV